MLQKKKLFFRERTAFELGYGLIGSMESIPAGGWETEFIAVAHETLEGALTLWGASLRKYHPEGGKAWGPRRSFMSEYVGKHSV